MHDITEQILRGMIEVKEQIQEENMFTECFDNDTISISDNMESEFMQSSALKTIKLLTIISLNENPTLNLSVAQPSKYKISKTSLGTGIMCYPTNALEIIKKQLKEEEIIIKITVEINIDTVLNLCSTKDKQYLRDVYKSISDKSIIKTDADFINYVCSKGTKKYNAIMGFIVLGNVIYSGSIISDYMGKGWILKDDKIIKKAEAI